MTINDRSSGTIETVYPSLFAPPTPSSSPLLRTTTMTTQIFDSEQRTVDARTWASQASSHVQYLSNTALTSLLGTLLPHLSSQQLAQLLPDRRRDFLTDLPPEVALHVLSFVDDVRTLGRAARVSRMWKILIEDEAPWKALCARRGFETGGGDGGEGEWDGKDLLLRIRKRKLAQPTQDGPGALTSLMNMLSAAARIDGPTESLASAIEGIPTSPMLRLIERKTKQSPAIAASLTLPPPPAPLPSPPPSLPSFSYRKHFKASHMTEYNWRHSGRLLRSHRSQDPGTVTSLAMDNEWIAVGLANSRVHVFSAATGVLARTLNGHDAGVWSLWLVSRGGGRTKSGAKEKAKAKEDNSSSMESFPSEEAQDGSWESILSSSTASTADSADLPFQSVFDSLNPPSPLDPDNGEGDEPEPDRQSDPCNASRGWGQANSLVVSGSCDKHIRVWDIKTGYCLFVLRGHRSTVRCIKMLHGRPVAVSGGRDHTLRVWDIQKGTLLRTLEGHTDAVRCLDIYGDKVVSGSYDCSVRLWDVDTGECLKVFNGHYHQVYTVAFDGERIASGGLDTTVRIWSASNGQCVALLQGHSALVCQLQLSSRTNTVITGSADGRIIIFKIAPPVVPSTSTSSKSSSSTTRLHPPHSTFPIATANRINPTPPSSPAMHPHPDNVSGYQILTRVQAHESSVAGLQFDDRRGVGGVGRKWVVSGGNDGRVILWEWDSESDEGGAGTGMVDIGSIISSGSSTGSGVGLKMVRDLTEPCEGLWKVAIRGDTAVICALRAGRTVLEIWSFRPVEEEL
ncbi:hypothetical protein M422DRAFT_34949 [Sphaerobolus stellatus SS14]|uniref:F-box domain-containing protein n=1 Tax=Sphaerobolus stellatus (strain SS14) TaxID=990650 RepID=A0A0C9VBK9_SPHS4|nr:hypothetical protein M422DRAFT_34949 [Sphaerobolus stellatus SS14]